MALVFSFKWQILLCSCRWWYALHGPYYYIGRGLDLNTYAEVENIILVSTKDLKENLVISNNTFVRAIVGLGRFFFHAFALQAT